MDSQKIARLGWIVAVILLGVSLILGFLLLTRGDGSLSSVRAQISEDCTSGTTRGDHRCEDALRELQALLVEIQVNRANEGSGASVSNVRVETKPAEPTQ